MTAPKTRFVVTRDISYAWEGTDTQCVFVVDDEDSAKRLVALLTEKRDAFLPAFRDLEAEFGASMPRMDRTLEQYRAWDAARKQALADLGKRFEMIDPLLDDLDRGDEFAYRYEPVPVWEDR